MGEGKSKVLVPMLACLWATRGHVFRLTALGTVLPETRDYLRTVLGGLIRKTVFTLPFSRKIDLSHPHQGAAVLELLTKCRLKKGILVMTPQERLSFDVKWIEDVVKANGPVLSRMLEISKIKFCDLLDEADEILRPSHQLVYAMGAKVELSAGEERWMAISSVLQILNSKRCKEIVRRNESDDFVIENVELDV